MNSLTRSAVVFFVLNTFALLAWAGPESLPSDKEMKQVALAPAPGCPDWSGFYVGGFGGYVRSDVGRDLSLFGGWDPSLTTSALNAGTRDLDFDGGEAGGLIGYNFQVQSLGARGRRNGRASLGARFIYRFRNSIRPEYFSDEQFVQDRLSGDVWRTHWLRLCRWLPYVTGGAAVGNLDYKQVLIFRPVIPMYIESGHGEDMNLGWMVGGGLEYALTKHWSLRADYKYVDLGHVGFRSNFGDGGGAAATQRADLTEHNATFGIVFQF